MTATLERRLGAVEKRMGMSNDPLKQLSDADLDARAGVVPGAIGRARQLARASHARSR